MKIFTFICLIFVISNIYSGIRKVPQDYPNIQSAIDSAQVGDTVFISNGVYYGFFRINKALSLIGESADSVIVRGRSAWVNSGPTIQIDSTDNVELISLKLSGESYRMSKGSTALSIKNSSSVKLNNVTLKGGNGVGSGKGGGYIWGPQNGGNALEVSNAKNIYAQNCKLYKGLPGTDNNIPAADSGFSILAEKNSSLTIVNSYVPFPLDIDETSSIRIDDKLYTKPTSWKKIPVNINYSLNGISLLNKKVGTITGEAGTILRTSDGGETWQLQSSGTDNTLHSIFLIDSLRSVAVGDNGTILRTTNGGTEWQSQISNTKYHLWSVVFTDSLTGIVVGTFGTILKTTDGGVTWNQKPSGTEYFFYSVSFFNKDTAFAVGDFGWWDTGITFRTSDGGETWNETAGVRFNKYFSISFSETLGMKVGSQIFTTINGGDIWSQKQSPCSGTWKGVFCYNDKNAIIVGNSKIALTTDGGEQWKWETYGKNISFNAVYVKEGIAIIAGENGTILKSTITDSITPGTGPKSYNFILEQNYPNPFNPSTKIRYKLAEEGTVTLKVYDFLGKEVSVLVNENKPAGEHEVVFNGIGLSSGVYFYKMQSGSYSAVKKFILLR